MLRKFWNRWWNELFFPVIAILVWQLSPFFLSKMDERAGTYDDGVLQIIFFTFIQFAAYTAIAWIFMRAVFAQIFKYFQTDFSFDFITKLTTWQKVKLSFSVFFALLFCLAILSRVL